MTLKGASFQSGISLSICLHGRRDGIRDGLEFQLVSIRHQPEYLPSHHPYATDLPLLVERFQSGISLSICLHPRKEARLCRCRRAVSIRHQPEYLPSHWRDWLEQGAPHRVSIRHQPEYLPSLVIMVTDGTLSYGFQSGISLSICLHTARGFMSILGIIIAYLFQSGISLSICLHKRPVANWGGSFDNKFQSGISLSICLHQRLRKRFPWSGERSVSIRHQPEYLPSR